MDTQTLADVTTQAAAQMSMWDMVWASDMVTKVVMIGLIATSVWSWAIIIEKVGTLRQVKRLSKAFEEKFWSGGSLEELFLAYAKSPKDPLSIIFVSAIQEWRRSMSERRKAHAAIKVSERIDKVMQIAIDKQVDKMETRMTFLASTGSVAPLLGLFGTVWGIMDSFNAIGATQSTNIAAVAPGVAEALFTTAVGLIAAIPAVIAYNKLTNDIERMAQRMETFSDELGAILSRQMEQTED